MMRGDLRAFIIPKQSLCDPHATAVGDRPFPVPRFFVSCALSPGPGHLSFQNAASDRDQCRGTSSKDVERHSSSRIAIIDLLQRQLSWTGRLLPIGDLRRACPLARMHSTWHKVWVGPHLSSNASYLFAEDAQSLSRPVWTHDPVANDRCEVAPRPPTVCSRYLACLAPFHAMALLSRPTAFTSIAVIGERRPDHSLPGHDSDRTERCFGWRPSSPAPFERSSGRPPTVTPFLQARMPGLTLPARLIAREHSERLLRRPL